MIIALMIAASLFATSYPCEGAGNHRSRAAVEKFKRQYQREHGIPCPEECKVYVYENGEFKVWRRCGRCQVDHICPLACCGKDTPSNMQWLTAEENQAKGAKDCRKHCR